MSDEHLIGGRYREIEKIRSELEEACGEGELNHSHKAVERLLGRR